VQASHGVSAVFDDPNLIGSAGLIPVMRLAERAGLHHLLHEHLTVASPNAPVKAASVLGGMLAGADCIDDLDVLRHGGMGKVFSRVRAPSTVGTFLRSFSFGHVRQLDAVHSRVLAGLATAVPRLLAGTDALAFVDVDDTIREVHGYAKQGAAYGYSGVKGVNAQLAILSCPTCAPVIAASRLRKGNVVSGHGAARLVTDAVTTARAAGVTGQVMVRADSGYYRQDMIAAAVRAQAWFSVTARMNSTVRQAITAIDEDAWTPIRYPRAIWDQDEQRWVCRGVRRGDPVHRVHLPPEATAGGLPAGGAPPAWASTPSRARTSCSPPGATTASSPTPPCPRSRPMSTTATTPSSSRSSPSSRTAPWRAPLPGSHREPRLAHPRHDRVQPAADRRCRRLPRHARARWATLRTHLITVPARIAPPHDVWSCTYPATWPWQAAWQDLWATATHP